MTVTYSCVRGGYPGEGNISDDPEFDGPVGYWHDTGTPGYGNDDYWVDGDYHLKSTSPCSSNSMIFLSEAMVRKI